VGLGDGPSARAARAPYVVPGGSRGGLGRSPLRCIVAILILPSALRALVIWAGSGLFPGANRPLGSRTAIAARASPPGRLFWRRDYLMAARALARRSRWSAGSPWRPIPLALPWRRQRREPRLASGRQGPPVRRVLAPHRLSMRQRRGIFMAPRLHRSVASLSRYWDSFKGGRDGWRCPGHELRCAPARRGLDRRLDRFSRSSARNGSSNPYSSAKNGDHRSR
jgi:hypothetical protein